MENEILYRQSTQLIQSRWPVIADKVESTSIDYAQCELMKGNETSLIINGIQLNSSYDSDKEANIIVDELPNTCTEINIYGIGNGRVIKSAIERHPTAVIKVHILHWMSFKLSLKLYDFTSWLQHKSLELMDASLYHHVRQPFVAIASELTIADDEVATLRDRICLELDSFHITKHKGGGNSQIQERIARNSHFLSIDLDIKQFSMDSSKPCVVVGAGPTLSLNLDWLVTQYKNRTCTIFAVDAAVPTLIKADVKPDLIVSIDKSADKIFTSLAREDLSEIPILYFPLVEPSFLESWPGQRSMSFSIGSTFDWLAKEHVNTTRLYSGGSVIHPTIDAAVKLSVEKIILLGADFSFIDNQTHAKDVPMYFDNVHVGAENAQHWVLNGLGEKNPTYLNFRGYLRDLEHYIELHPHIAFYNSSLLGAVINGTKIWSDFSDE